MTTDPARIAAGDGPTPNGAAPGALRQRTPTVTVVIPCFTERRWHLLMRAVRSAWDQTYPCDLVVVVDHNPRLLARLRCEIGARALVLPNRLPRGASGARNTGALEARSELVAFLEDDAAADPTWLEHLVRAYGAAPFAVGFGGAVKPIWEQPVPRWFPAEFLWAIGVTDPARTGADVRNVWAGNMLLRRGSFLEAEGFRIGFGKIGTASQPEDTELCIRMNAQAEPGPRWTFVPEAVVFHQVPAERGTWSFFLRRCWSEGEGKQALSSLAGPGSRALEEEARFIRNVLTGGVFRNVVATARGDPFGLARAAAILVGTAAAAAGFVFAAVRPASRRRSARPERPSRAGADAVTDAPMSRNEAAEA